ncbi:MAG: hypothetical protein ACREOD_01075 [Candidatus Dormibacteria bacterium]
MVPEPGGQEERQVLSISHTDPRLERIASQGGLLAVLALLFFVDLFLPWYRGAGAGFACPDFAQCSFAQSSNGWGGAGTVAGVLAALLFCWEGLRVARVHLYLGRGYRSLVSAGLGLGVLLFTIVDVAAALTWMAPRVGPGPLYGGVFIWLALGLAIVIGALGLLHWQVWQASARGNRGAAARPVSGPPPAAGQAAPAPAPGGPRRCPSCGRASPAEARYCANCGTSFEAQPPTPRRPRTPPA